MGILCLLAFAFLVVMPFGVLALRKVNRWPTGQFTIRSMMLFILLWAVCLSQIPAIRFGIASTADAFAWHQSLTVVFAWVVLAVYYATVRQFASLALHSSGVLFFLLIIASTFVFDAVGSWQEIKGMLCGGMVFGSFLGLIFYSLILFSAMFQPPSSPPQKEDQQP